MRSALQTAWTVLLLAVCFLPGTAPAAHKQPKEPAVVSLPIVFNPAGGVFTNPISLQITSKNPGPIHYTLDGTEP
ncbi:MAG TPA: chitobiase/beta-hexosaminidase C-terminal domain-containing protein, partial [Verrucomicrobiae bacterium]|nr:chitobiase/beta-hexosaminidase C-terminal domain-containing protein [Verrucomicrobiae bacterium]